MTPDTNPPPPSAEGTAHQNRAASLYHRVAALVIELDTVRKALEALKASTHGGSTTDQDDDVAPGWTALAASVAGLEAAATRARDQSESLSTKLLGKPAADVLPRLSPTPTSDSPDDLEALIRAQRAALDALNEQISAAETALSPRSSSGRDRGDIGTVEIQDVNEFLSGSPIASVPINASYYQRILEAARATDDEKRPMGAILVEAGLITERQLKNALRHQREGRRRPLGSLLVDLGYTTDTAIAQTIAAQLALPYINLSNETVHQEALDLVPVHMARRHASFPVNVIEGALYVAMANPLDLIALEDLRLASNKHVRPCVASREEIASHINRHYAGSMF